MGFNYIHCNTNGSKSSLYNPMDYYDDDDFGSEELLGSDHEMPYDTSSSCTGSTFSSNSDNFYYAMHRADRRMAGMRVAFTVMLNAWRKRRGEVKFLHNEVGEMKRRCIKYKMQMNVYKALYRIEKERNDKLHGRLMHTIKDFNREQISYNNLASTLFDLQTDRNFLENALERTQNEFHELSNMFENMKIDLINTIWQKRSLQCNLHMEKHKAQQCEDQRNELIYKVFEIRKRHKQFSDHLDVQENDINIIKKRFNDSYADIELVQQDHEIIIKNQFIREEEYDIKIENLMNEFYELQEYSDIDRVLQTVKMCIQKLIAFQRLIFRIIHYFLYYLVPTTPPPRQFPIFLNVRALLQKIVRFIKR